MKKPSEKPLVDTLVEAYVTWREARLRVSDAAGASAATSSGYSPPGEP